MPKFIVNIPDLLRCLLMADVPLGCDGISHLIRNTETCASGSKDNHAEVLELLLADVEACHDGCQGHAASALDIIIEAGKVWAVAVQKTSRCIHVRFDRICHGKETDRC